MLKRSTNKYLRTSVDIIRLVKATGNVRFGSLAALQDSTISTAAFRGKADIE
jgi:hypothetical protein